MKRHEAVKVILEHVGDDDLILFTTGMISREAFTVKDREGSFYMIGSMGLSASIGLGLALNKPDKRVIVVDGDGSILMNLGNLPTIGSCSPKNFTHIILDNEAYDSTGGQRSITNVIDLSKIAETSKYNKVVKVSDIKDLHEKIAGTMHAEGPVFILVKVEKGKIEGIGRVTHTPEEIRDRFKSRAQK